MTLRPLGLPTVMGEQGGVLSPEDVLYICGTPAAFDRYYEEFPT